MLGHALLAFALVASVARFRGFDPSEAIQVGVAAGVLAMVPDVDMVYAPVGLAGVDPAIVGATGFEGVFTVTGAFWGASTVVHRSATHSLVLAVPIAGAVALWTLDRRWARVGAAATVVMLGVVAWMSSGPLDGGVVVLYGVTALAIAGGIRRHTDWCPRTTVTIALVALVSHPFGDLFTGDPPRLLYPLGGDVLSGPIVLSGDPTLHLLGVFGLELGLAWLAAATYLELSGESPRRFVDRRAMLAVGYGFTALVLHPPTLESSYQFVFSIIAVGLVLGIPEVGIPTGRRLRSVVRSRSMNPDRTLSVALTGIAAVTVGWIAYLGAYLT